MMLPKKGDDINCISIGVRQHRRTGYTVGDGDGDKIFTNYSKLETLDKLNL